MGRPIQVTLSEEHATQIEQEAEELGLSRTRYIRQRLEAGRVLFQSSDRLDGDMLNSLIHGTETGPVNSELQTPDDDITDQIVTNLPTDEERALTQEDLRQAVFGSKDEQLEAIETALRRLNDTGKVSPAFDGGYVKNE